MFVELASYLDTYQRVTTTINIKYILLASTTEKVLTKLRSRIFRKQTIASYPKEQKNQKKNFKNVYRYLGLDSRKEL